MYGVGGVPYMGPLQYDQIMQGAASVNPYGQYGSGQIQNNMMQSRAQQNIMQILKGRPVSGIEEARASMIDMDGSLFVFPDIANQRIYTKQINLNGEPEFRTYVLMEEQKQDAKTKQIPLDCEKYVLKDDFEEIMGAVMKKLKSLERKGEMKDVTGISDDGAAVTKK